MRSLVCGAHTRQGSENRGGVGLSDGLTAWGTLLHVGTEGTPQDGQPSSRLT